MSSTAQSSPLSTGLTLLEGASNTMTNSWIITASRHLLNSNPILKVPGALYGLHIRRGECAAVHSLTAVSSISLDVVCQYVPLEILKVEAHVRRTTRLCALFSLSGNRFRNRFRTF